MVYVRNRYPDASYRSNRGGINDARYLSPYSYRDGVGGGVWSGGELACMARGGCCEASCYTFKTGDHSRYVQKAAQQRLMSRVRRGNKYGASEDLARTPRMRSVNLGRKKKHGRQYE